jgi:hypothetical protein
MLCSLLPARQSCPALIVVINPIQGDVMLACPSHHLVSRSPTPVDPSPTGTLDGSTSSHVLPSPPPIPLAQPRDPSRQPCFELRVILRTSEIDSAEEVHGNALVAVVRGTRLAVSPTQVLHFLQVHPHEVQVRRSFPDDFIILFAE